MATTESPEQMIEMFVREIRGGESTAESTVTVGLVKLLGLTGKRTLHPAAEERIEGIVRSYLRTTDRLCWYSSDTVLIVALTELEGALQLMARFREAQVKFAQAAGGSLEIVWGLACSHAGADRPATDLLQEARLNLNRMIAAQ